MRSMEVTAPGKLVVLAIVLTFCFFSIIAGQLGYGDTPDIIKGAAVGILSYLLGNGAGAKSGLPAAPVIGPKTEG